MLTSTQLPNLPQGWDHCSLGEQLPSILKGLGSVLSTGENRTSNLISAVTSSYLLGTGAGLRAALEIPWGLCMKLHPQPYLFTVRLKQGLTKQSGLAMNSLRGL